MTGLQTLYAICKALIRRHRWRLTLFIIGYSMPQERKEHRMTALIISIFGVIISAIAVLYAAKQTTIAQDTAQRQLRAYVGVDMQGMNYGQQPDGKIVAFYKIFDYGQTPAKDMQIDGSIKILPSDLPNSYRPEYHHFNSAQPNIVIFPGHSFTGNIISETAYSPNEMKAAMAFRGDQKIYLFLRITYKDVFNVERHTFFCAFLLRQSDTGAAFVWNITHNYNDFD
jgi:hypothetical protein